MGGPLYVWLMYVASRPFNSVFQGAGAEATAARLIMRATLAIKTTEAISNVESPHRGREREEGRAASRYVWHFDIDEKLQLRLEGQGEGGYEVFPGRRAPTLKCNFCGYIC